MGGARDPGGGAAAREEVIEYRAIGATHARPVVDRKPALRVQQAARHFDRPVGRVQCTHGREVASRRIPASPRNKGGDFGERPRQRTAGQPAFAGEIAHAVAGLHRAQRSEIPVTGERGRRSMQILVIDHPRDAAPLCQHLGGEIR